MSGPRAGVPAEETEPVAVVPAGLEAPTEVDFPFTAIVGMESMGLALLLAAVSPGIGGVLVRGEKGTAKSTMVRALAGVLPPVDVLDGCRFSCDPAAVDPSCPDAGRAGPGEHRRPVRLVELPVGASEDRVVGSLHLDRLLASGQVSFEPGLLAQAHRGILYVDEVNLLPDHLVDTLLDSAAMGRARVEREGVSVTHAAKFVLVGTMNPEEGDLRPQLLDRFGLTVDVAASREPGTRVEVMRRRLAYEADPAAFAARFADREEELRASLSAAQELLPRVVLGDRALEWIAAICADYDVDGLRGDLVTARAAVAHAAWRGRTRVTAGDVRVAARLALPHRRRRNPFDTPGSAAAELERVLDAHLPDGDEPPPDDDAQEPPEPTESPDDGVEQPVPAPDDQAPDPGGQGGSAPSRDEAPGAGQDDAGPEPEPSAAPPEGPSGSASGQAPDSRPAERSAAPYAARLFTLDRVGRGVTGRRSRAITAVGRHLRGVDPSDPRARGLAVTDTVRAAAGQQVARGRSTGPLKLHGSDLRRSLREGKEGNLVVFLVDASGSMGARSRMAEVKTAVLSLLLDAYQRRDKVAVVTFSGDGARTLLPATSSVELAQRRLDEVVTGGRTPLAEGLAQAGALVRREHARDPMRRPLLICLTDGRATAGPDALARSRAAAQRLADQRLTTVVVDCESRRGLRLHLARELATALRGDYLDLAEVAAATLVEVARSGAA